MGNLWALSVGENGKMGRKQSGQALGARLRAFQIHRINSLNVQKLIACKMCTHLAKTSVEWVECRCECECECMSV